MRISAASLVAAKIESLSDDAIVAARDMMPYGTTNAIYNCLSRMFLAGTIVRVSRGLYMKNTPNVTIPAATEILKAKKAAFGALIFKHAEQIAQEIFQPARTASETKAHTNGCSSKFESIRGTLLVQSQAPRKRKPDEDRLGFVLRALWQLTKKDFNERVLLRATEAFTPEERMRFRRLAGCMPWWISNVVVKCGAFPLGSES